MPLLVATTARPVVPTPPQPTGDQRWQLSWLAPDGSEHPLNPADLTVRALATSAFSTAAPILVTTDDNPREGVTVRHTQPQPQTLVLPLHVHGSSHMDLVHRWRRLGDAFAQTEDLGPGWLRVRRPDGSAREIAAVYESGWEGDPEHGPGVNWDRGVVILLAPSPYWRDPTPVVVRRAEQDTVDYYDPYTSISSGAVLGETEATNPGEVRAWPQWTLTGPLTSFTATHEATGESWTMDPDWDGDGPLPAGQQVTIDTDPVRVRGPAGQPWLGAIDFPGGVLWPLRRGTSRVNFVATGAGEGTEVQMRFHPRFRSA